MQKQVMRIVCAFVVIMVFLMLSRFVFGVGVQENFLFSRPDNCAEGCARNMYAQYCNSPYLKDGPLALCNCKWNSQSKTCEGSRAPNSQCAL